MAFRPKQPGKSAPKPNSEEWRCTVGMYCGPVPEIVKNGFWEPAYICRQAGEFHDYSHPCGHFRCWMARRPPWSQVIMGATRDFLRAIDNG